MDNLDLSLYIRALVVSLRQDENFKLWMETNDYLDVQTKINTLLDELSHLSIYFRVKQNILDCYQL